MKKVVLGFLGTTLDKGKKSNRWSRWRPSVSLCQHESLPVDRIELLYSKRHEGLGLRIREDIQQISPNTQVNLHPFDCADPWDFEAVYSELYDFARKYQFDTASEEYLVHITTGTHVAQICLYLLSEANFLPGKLLQTSPQHEKGDSSGSYQIINLDLSKYDQIASRFQQESQEDIQFLKQGIATRNKSFNQMIEQIEQVSIHSQEPILLIGETGTGKSKLVQRIYELKKRAFHVTGDLVVVNCATLQGDNAMASLFGHSKGAFMGATSTRKGLLRQANGGLLYLDEIAALGLKEQAMLLRAIEEKKFLPVGSDQERSSDFQLIATTNSDLRQLVAEGKFRKDLLSRIHVWTYALPSLKERVEDIEPNVDFELHRYTLKANHLISFNSVARIKYVNFAKSVQAPWLNNFRDLNASINRMAVLSQGGRITEEIVKEEIARLQNLWRPLNSVQKSTIPLALSLLGEEKYKRLDLFEQLQLESILKICQSSHSLAEAGRTLFDQSRKSKKSQNDSHRLKQLLAKHGIIFSDIKNL